MTEPAPQSEPLPLHATSEKPTFRCTYCTRRLGAPPSDALKSSLLKPLTNVATMSTDPDIVHNLFAYLQITQEFDDFITADIDTPSLETDTSSTGNKQEDIDTPSLETDTSSTGDKREEEHLRLVKICSLKVLDEFKKAYLGKIISDAKLKPLIHPHKALFITDAFVVAYREGIVSFRGALFAVIIPRFGEGKIKVTVEGPEGEEVEMDWKRRSMIVVSRKCDLQINGPGKLVGVVILFHEREYQVQQKAIVASGVDQNTLTI